MLYHLNDDLLPAIQDNKPEVWSAISILLLRYQEGMHILSLSRRMLSAICTANSPYRLNWSKVQAAEKNLGDFMIDRASLRSQAPVYVEVVPDTHESGWTKVGTQDVFRLCVRHINDLDSAASTCLIVEGSYDASVYRRAAMARMLRRASHQKLPFRKVVLDDRIGGGGNIGAVVKRRSAQRAPLFCVVDSDRDRPTGSGGSTLNSAQMAIDEARMQCPASLYELPARELENLLPARLIKAALTAGDRVLTDDQEARLKASWSSHLMFPVNAKKRYAQLKDDLDKYTLARCAELLDELSPDEAGRLIFTDDDGTWDNLTTLLAWWGCSDGKVGV